MLQPGEAIDIWVVEAALGSGGMGSVYRCHNRTATRIMAAIKVLEGGLHRHPEAQARFVREAEILFQLDHPNIVKVRNIRTETEPPYLEMEFVAGESLDERLRRGSLPYPEAVRFMRQCADALAYLHDKNIRHRDIKPANLLVQKDGRVKLVDFGLAVEQDHTRITQAGMAFGTVSYAPPEWITPDTLDPAKWDIYALGVVFYEMLTGQLAFPVSGQGTARQQAMQVIIAKQNHPPLDPGPSFHDDVRSLIADMTRSDAAGRVAESRLLVARTDALEPTLRGAAGVTLAPSKLDALPAVDPKTFDDDGTPTPAPGVTVPVPAGTVRPVLPKGPDRPRAVKVALAAVGGLGALLGAGALFGLTAALGLWLYNGASRPSTRPLVLSLDGADGAPVDVTVGGLASTAVDGGRRSFAEVPAGVSSIRWAAGADCTVTLCPGEGCPAWCTHGSEPLEVVAGEGAQEHAVVVAPAVPRDAVVRLPGLDGSDLPVRATLGGVEGARTASGAAFGAVPPGPATLEVVVGLCAPEARGCWPGACPPGCSSSVAELTVPVAGPPIPAEVDVGPPVAAAPVVPKPGPAVPRSSGRGLVTLGDLAAWLPQNPDYAPGGTFAARGGSGYLRGWTAEGPPAGRKPGEAATGVSAALALEFCKKRGGLPGIDAEPEVPATAYEIRVDGTQVRLLEDLGDGTSRVVPTDALRATSGASFRCAR